MGNVVSCKITEAVRIHQAMDNHTQTDMRGRELLVKSLNRRNEVFAPRDRFQTPSVV